MAGLTAEPWPAFLSRLGIDPTSEDGASGDVHRVLRALVRRIEALEREVGDDHIPARGAL